VAWAAWNTAGGEVGWAIVRAMPAVGNCHTQFLFLNVQLNIQELRSDYFLETRNTRHEERVSRVIVRQTVMNKWWLVMIS
jgi:hypothetical protein